MEAKPWTIKRLVDELVLVANKHGAWDSVVDMLVEVKVPEKCTQLQVQAPVQDLAWCPRSKRVVLINDEELGPR